MSLPLVWTVFYGAWIVLEVWVAVARRAGKEATGKDRGTQLLLWGVIVASMTANGFVRGYAIAPIHAPELPLKLAAILILVAGLTVRMVAIRSLGQAFTASVATHSGQQLQRTGLYSLVRHPSYLGMEIIFLAIALHAMSWLSLVVVLVPTTLAVLWRIRVEEQALSELFGAEYRAYCQTVKRLIPGVY